MKNVKNLIKNIIFIVIFLSITLGIFKFHYERNYGIRTSPPSKLYSKEIMIDSGYIKGYPSLITTDDGYVAAYTSEDKVFLFKLDKLGNKIKKLTINGYSKYINDVNLVHSKSVNYLVFTTYFGGDKKLIQISFDDQLNNIKETNQGSMKFTKRIDDDSLVFCYKDKVVFKNFNEGYTNVLNYSNISMVSGTKTNNSYYVQMIDTDRNINGVEINKGKIVHKYHYTFGKISSIEFSNMISTSDSQNIYNLFEVKLKGEEKGVYMLTFPRTKGNPTYKQLQLSNEMYYYGLIPASSSKDGNFLAITTLPSEGSESSIELAEISIEDGKIETVTKATRTADQPYYPCYMGDSLIFTTVNDDSSFNIYIESKNKDFKKLNNKITSKEKKDALTDTIGDEITSIAFAPILGFSWMFVGAILIGIISFIEWKSNDLAEDILTYISYIITAIFKTYIIYKTVYVTFGQPTGIMANTNFGCLISIIISLICFIFFIYKKKNDKRDMAYLVFFIPLIIDTVLTQILFVPYF